MALVLKECARLYRRLIYDLADKRTEHLPLVKSPIPTIFILTVYLLFVLKWGPRYMRDRKPFNLKKILIGYNAFQMVYCAVAVTVTSKSIPIAEWKCTPILSPLTNNQITLLGGYSYFILKLIDLLDTVFFVLRKNNRQITFLHVFHHTGVVILMWVGMKYFTGGQSFYIPFINSIVHVVMYGYYLLSAYDDKYKKSIWWKKYITQLQLLQFGIFIILYTTPLIFDCGYPKILNLVLLLFNGILVAMFANFYYKTYIKKKHEKH